MSLWRLGLKNIFFEEYNFTCDSLLQHFLIKFPELKGYCYLTAKMFLKSYILAQSFAKIWLHSFVK